MEKSAINKNNPSIVIFDLILNIFYLFDCNRVCFSLFQVGDALTLTSACECWNFGGYHVQILNTLTSACECLDSGGYQFKF